MSKVLQRLRDAGLQIDLKKYEQYVTETKYLGYIISTEGIKVDPAKIEILDLQRPPRTVRGVQSFLGFCNFYKRFIRDYGKIAKPLVRLTRADVAFNFDQDCLTVFTQLKDLLTSVPVLRYYDPELSIMIETDVSDRIIGGILSQEHLDGQHPVAYYSKTISPAEYNYEVYNKEILTIIKAFKEQRVKTGSSDAQIKVYTDHKLLKYFITTKQLTSRQARWAEALAQYDFMIHYRLGKDNTGANTLTRREDKVDF